eukprot:15365785-Ditylum_brightwellii.AAC.1
MDSSYSPGKQIHLLNPQRNDLQPVNCAKEFENNTHMATSPLDNLTLTTPGMANLVLATN